MDQRALQQQSQKLHLSPQLRQYLKFLYLPQMELKEALQQELAENPILEEIQESPQTDSDSPEQPEEKRDDPPPEDASDDFAPEIDFSRKSKQDLQSLHQFQEASITKPISLTEHLERQLTFQNWTEEEMSVAKQLIGNLDSEGFLRVDLNDIVQNTHASLEIVEHTLKLVQSLEPAGIAARSLEECLQIQLRQHYSNYPVYQIIAAKHLNDVARRDAKSLARKLDIPVASAEDAIQAITHLDPRPARNFAETKHLQMVPDAQIHFKNGSQTDFDIEIFKEYLPRFRISPEYRRMMRDAQVDAATKNYIKSKIGDGSQLMKALELRESTLRLISEEIVKTQADFFVHGFSHLKPLRLKDLADRLEMHPSTISRAIHEKYVITPQGTLPFKSFFSQRVETGGDAEDESQKSITLRIQSLIQAEDPTRPLSDQQIAEKLKQENITLARRTVAKYRDLLKILPTHLRKKRN